MICYLFSEPTYFLFSSDVPALLYYSYIPTTLALLFVGSYVFWKGNKFLLNRLLFAISVAFSFWTTSILIEWTNVYSNLILFVWNFQALIFGLIGVFCIYFIYVFLNKEDVSVRLRFVFLGLLSPILFLTPTFYLSGFDITNCDAFQFEWLPLRVYYIFIGVLAIIWIFILLIRKYRIATPSFKRQIALMGMGMELFLFMFFIWTTLTYYLTTIGALPDSRLEMYGMFGIVAFMIYINILIVEFKTFNVKLLATQALVWGLVALIGSQFFFIKTTTNLILNSITFIGVMIFGKLLIDSVKKEVKQKEELARLNIELEDLIKQRESLVHLVTHKVKGSFTRSKYIFAGILDGTFGDISPEIKKRAEQGLESDNMGIETVDLVLSVANMQKGIVKYDMKVFDFKELVTKTLSEKSISAEMKGLKLESNIKEDTYNVLGDAFWLKEAVNNLIENSIKYTKEGTVTVSLEKKENKVLLSVKDTGVGVTEEDKKNLFTEGGRGKDSVKINVDSTGYGLYSVKLIMDEHKGKVWLESEGAGKGSTFFLELDAAK